MKFTNLVLGRHLWKRNEWPESVVVSHEGQREAGVEYFPERTCKNLSTRKDGFACSVCECEVVGCMIDDFGSWDNPLLFCHCPNCGARVVRYAN